LLCFFYKRKRLAIKLIALCFLALSCSEENNFEPIVEDHAIDVNSKAKGLSVVQGTMKFDDLETFKSVIEGLQGLSSEELVHWSLEQGHDESLYLQLQKDYENTEMDHQEIENAFLDMPDPYFAVILDVNGNYMIGNELHHIGNTFEKWIEVSEDDEFASIDWNNDDRVSKFKIKYGRGDYALAEQNTSKRLNPLMNDHKMDDYDWYPYSSSGENHKKVHLKIWNRYYLAYATIGASMNNYIYARRSWPNRNKFRYKRDKMEYGEIRISGTYYHPGDDETQYRNEVKGRTQKESIELTFIGRAGLPDEFTNVDIWVQYVYRDGGQRTEDYSVGFND
jgi:hypothetical protein